MTRSLSMWAFAVLAICQPAFAADYVRQSNPYFVSTMPRAVMTSTDTVITAGEPVATPEQAPAPQTKDGYPFTSQCGCQDTCTGLWDGYSRGCCWTKLHDWVHSRGCGGCNPCGPAWGHRLHNCGVLKGGCRVGGCFGGSFAGGFGSCGGCGISDACCGVKHLCGNFGNACRRFSLHGLWGCGCETTDCGCGEATGKSTTQSTLNGPTSPPIPTPAVEEAPASPPAEKSASRTYHRTYGIFPTNW